MNVLAFGFGMLALTGFLGFLLWACISLAENYSYRAGLMGLRICGIVVAVGIIGALGAVWLIPPEEPAAPDLHNATITQNGFLHCTFLNASDPASGYVCLPKTAQGAGP